jgi:hypothetical protein
VVLVLHGDVFEYRIHDFELEIRVCALECFEDVQRFLHHMNISIESKEREHTELRSE